LTTALAAQSDPPISLARSGETVLAFESITSCFAPDGLAHSWIVHQVAQD
jgi:hypothetical protein